MQQVSGDEGNAGVFDYGVFDTNALSIVGKGTSGINRGVRIFDSLGIGYSPNATNGALLVNGNVGIGTTTPQDKLDVNGNILLGGNTNTFAGTVGFTSANGPAVQFWGSGTAHPGKLFFNTANVARMTVDASGNVGIGTTTPATNLAVTGHAYLTGGLGVGLLNTTSGAIQTTGSIIAGSSGLTMLSTDQGGALELHGTSGSGNPYFDFANGSNDYDFRYQFTPSANRLSLTSSSTANILNILGSGNVGIGTTNPAANLDLRGSLTNGAAFTITGNATTYWPQVAMYLNDLGTNGRLFSIGSNAGLFQIADQTAAVSRLVINSSGNVGIGTASPAGPLYVAGGSRTFNVDYTSSDGGFVWQSLRRNAAEKWWLLSDTSTGELTFQSRAGTAVNALTLTQAGHIGIGTTNPGKLLTVVGSSAGTQVGYIEGAYSWGGNVTLMEWARGGGAVSAAVRYKDTGTSMEFYSPTGHTVAYTTSSDRRVKENIATTTLGLDTLLRLPVREFAFINDPARAITTGFIAQELREVFPSAVTTNGDNGVVPLGATSSPWGVDYGRITP
ncbi:tail fiber domain-containing protein, partial [Candidatus Kaiserbacteria bacterium]|nr:tail fiber domain-containing protein [Candidatus Kaiserbacteria bacterium]